MAIDGIYIKKCRSEQLSGNRTLHDRCEENNNWIRFIYLFIASYIDFRPGSDMRANYTTFY